MLIKSLLLHSCALRMGNVLIKGKVLVPKQQQIKAQETMRHTRAAQLSDLWCGIHTFGSTGRSLKSLYTSLPFARGSPQLFAFGLMTRKLLGKGAHALFMF